MMTRWLFSPLLLFAACCQAHEAAGEAGVALDDEAVGDGMSIDDTASPAPSLERLLFLPGQEMTVGSFGNDDVLCRNIISSPEYRYVVIVLWTGIPFSDVRTSKSRCDFGVYSSGEITDFTPDTQRFSTSDCLSDIRIEDNRVEVLRVFARRDDPRTHFQCAFRVNIAAMGYVGAINIPESEMFDEVESPQIFYRVALSDDYFAPVMPTPHVEVQAGCRRSNTYEKFPRGLSYKEALEHYSNFSCLE